MTIQAQGQKEKKEKKAPRTVAVRFTAKEINALIDLLAESTKTLDKNALLGEGRHLLTATWALSDARLKTAVKS